MTIPGLPRRLRVAAIVAATVLAVPAPAMAASRAGKPGGGGGGGTTPIGNDISYPQCTSSTSANLPSGQAFGIVGLNGGVANDFNRCFNTELTWAVQTSSGAVASQPKAQIYLNTGDPGPTVSDWPTTGTNIFGTCGAPNTSPDSPACAFQYGLNMATADIGKVGNPGSYPWWLDVETANSWQSGSADMLDLNTEVLQGMEQAFSAANLPPAGVYSTTYQWGVITGGNTIALAGVPDWLPGARTQQGAKSNCGQTPFTGGGSKVTLTQWTTTYDNDYSCV